MNIILTCKDGQDCITNVEEEIYFYNGSLYLDGEQIVIYNKDIADDNDIVSFKITL